MIFSLHRTAGATQGTGASKAAGAQAPRAKSTAAKIQAVLVALALAIVLVPQPAAAQQSKNKGAEVWTKKYLLSDFTAKTTKVVLTGNFSVDTFYKQIFDAWTISNYEFCTQAEYEKLKDSPDYYFIVTYLTQFKGETEPGLRLMDIEKGGVNEKGKKLKVCTLPISVASHLSDENFEMIPILLQIVQSYLDASFKSDVFAYGGLNAYAKSNKLPKGTVLLTEWEEAHTAFMDAESGMAYVYVVEPENPVKGHSYRYKMTIGTDDAHTLYYFDRELIK